MNMIENQDWYPLIANVAAKKLFESEQSILAQDEPADYVSLILSGRAKAVSYSENGDQTWLSYFTSGDFIGHVSLLSDQPINYEVVSETDITVLRIPVSAMESLLTQDIELNRVVSKDLARRLDNMMRRLVEAFTLSARGRICAELTRLSAPIGVDPGRHIIRPNPVFVDLALRVNSTRETVSRTVSDLQKKGVVSRAPGALIVESPDRLKAAVGA